MLGTLWDKDNSYSRYNNKCVFKETKHKLFCVFILAGTDVIYYNMYRY